MKSNKYTLTWRDVGKALVVMLIANLLGLVMGLPEGELPTWNQIKVNLIMSVKFSVIPYILKNFFTNDVPDAVKTVEKASLPGVKPETQN